MDRCRFGPTRSTESSQHSRTGVPFIDKSPRNPSQGPTRSSKDEYVTHNNNDNFIRNLSSVFRLICNYWSQFTVGQRRQEVEAVDLSGSLPICLRCLASLLCAEPTALTHSSQPRFESTWNRLDKPPDFSVGRLPTHTSVRTGLWEGKAISRDAH